MRVQAVFVIVAQWATLIYAIYAVHNRNDRRKVPQNFSQGLHGLTVFAVLLLGLALLLTEVANGRKFIAVREIFEMGFICSCIAVCLALRILKGAPYDRGKPEKPERGGDHD
jgi:hypothetical protein